MGPHPYPWMVREFQRVVGDEARAQCRALLDGADPDVVVACVGGGSNAIGTFAGFVDTDARLVGVEAGGLGLEIGSPRRGGQPRRARRRARHALAVPAGRGRPGARGARRSPPGSTTRASAPSTRCSPRTGRAEYYVGRPTPRCSTGFQLLAATEGIVPALEPAHALGWLAREAGPRGPARLDGARHPVGPGRQGRRPGRRAPRASST